MVNVNVPEPAFANSPLPWTAPLNCVFKVSLAVRTTLPEIVKMPGLPLLSSSYPDADRALVHVKLKYTAGVDNLDTTLRELEKIFPRWYARDWKESGALDDRIVVGEAPRGKSFEDTVRDYLKAELVNHADAEREAVLARAEQLLREA